MSVSPRKTACTRSTQPARMACSGPFKIYRAPRQNNLWTPGGPSCAVGHASTRPTIARFQGRLVELRLPFTMQTLGHARSNLRPAWWSFVRSLHGPAVLTLRPAWWTSVCSLHACTGPEKSKLRPARAVFLGAEKPTRSSKLKIWTVPRFVPRPRPKPTGLRKHRKGEECPG